MKTFLVLLIGGLGMAYGISGLEGMLGLCARVDPGSKEALIAIAIIVSLWALVFITMLVINASKKRSLTKANLYCIACVAGLVLVLATASWSVLVFGHEAVKVAWENVSAWQIANADTIHVVFVAGWAFIGASFGYLVGLVSAELKNTPKEVSRETSDEPSEDVSEGDEH